MLDEYKESQSIVYNQLKNILSSNLSHAYLFNTNDNVFSEKIIISFIKSIICPKNYLNSNSCNDCVLCKRIDEGNYSEIKIIKPEGLWIKKEQLLELQKEFSTKAIEGKKRIYVIFEAEKLNKQSANSLLKFLEEPEEGIIAILVTNRINLVLDTIISRCQVITFRKNKLKDYASYYKTGEKNTLIKLFFVFQNGQDVVSYINDEKSGAFLNNVIDFIKKYEESNIKMLVNTKKYFHDKFSAKEDIDYAIEIILLFYKDVIRFKIKEEVEIFDDYLEDVKRIANKNTREQLLNKIREIINIKDLVKNNININLLIDKLVIRLEGDV